MLWDRLGWCFMTGLGNIKQGTGGIPPASKEVHYDFSGAQIQKLEAITDTALEALHTALQLLLYKITLCRCQIPEMCCLWWQLGKFNTATHSKGILLADIHVSLTDSCRSPVSATTQPGSMEGTGTSEKVLCWSTLHQIASILCTTTDHHCSQCPFWGKR